VDIDAGEIGFTYENQYSTKTAFIYLSGAAFYIHAGDNVEGHLSGTWTS
jgi:hypothetical protein